jgi:ketosteroid isomerase-like protein
MIVETSRRNRKPDDAMKAAIAFVERINACNAEGLCELTTEDHRFVDSTGAAQVGRERMRVAWLQYFAMFPDYWIAISTIFSSGEPAALLGTT